MDDLLQLSRGMQGKVRCDKIVFEKFLYLLRLSLSRATNIHIIPSFLRLLGWYSLLSVKHIAFGVRKARPCVY